MDSADMESFIHPELNDILLDICHHQLCSRCPLSLRGLEPDEYACMAVKIKHNIARPEYFRQVWRAYSTIFPDKALTVSDEVKELLGVKPVVQINVTEEDMMNLFS